MEPLSAVASIAGKGLLSLHCNENLFFFSTEHCERFCYHDKVRVEPTVVTDKAQ